MAYKEIDLADDETLVCLFLRGEGESIDSLVVADFQRRPEIHEGGISFYRQQECTYKEMVHRVLRSSKKRRGMAKISVKQIKDAGFKILADIEQDRSHVCIHCAECNGAEKDCRPNEGNCPLLRPAGQSPAEDGHVFRKRLATSMEIIFEARLFRTELLEVFGGDIQKEYKNVAGHMEVERIDDGKKRAKANVDYERRWSEHFKKKT